MWLVVARLSAGPDSVRCDPERQQRQADVRAEVRAIMFTVEEAPGSGSIFVRLSTGAEQLRLASRGSMRSTVRATR